MTGSTVPDGFIIEHDTRGVLVDLDHDPFGSGPCVHLEWRARFSPTKLRSEGRRFFSTAEVRMAWSRLSPAIRRGASVRRWGSWSKVAESELT